MRWTRRTPRDDDEFMASKLIRLRHTQPRLLWAGVVCLLTAGTRGAGTAAPGEPEQKGTPDTCVLYLERAASPVQGGELGMSDQPPDEAVIAIARELASLAAAPDAFERGTGLTGLRRAAAIALWQNAPIKIVVFGAVEHPVNTPLAGQLDAVNVVFEFAYAGSRVGLKEKLAQAAPPTNQKPSHRWQSVACTIEKDTVLVALGSNAIECYKAVGAQAFRASICRDHPAVRGMRDDRLLSGVVNLEAARTAWPGTLADGTTAKVLRVWSIGNLRSLSFDVGLIGSLPGAKGDGSVFLRLASSARSDAIGREHPFDVHLPQAADALGKPALKAAAEWGSRIRLALRSAGVVNGPEKLGLELRLDELIRRFGSSMGAKLRIEPAGVQVAGARPMLVVRALLRSPDSRENAAAAIAGMLAVEGAKARVRSATNMKDGWVFSGAPTPLCEQAAWCITAGELVAVIDLGNAANPVDLDAALAAAVADARPPAP